MRIAFDPASPARLRRFGIGLNFDRPVVFTADFAVEAPIAVAAAIDTALPLRIGAFSTVAGGRLRHVAIGRYCTLGHDVQIGQDAPPDSMATTSPVGHVRDPHGWASLLGHDSYVPPGDHTPRRTGIGHDVWIGQGVFLRPGIAIGDGAVIASRAVVLDDVAPYAVVEGAPARTERMRFGAETVARLRDLAWWRFNLFHLPPELPGDVMRFLDHVEAAVARGALEPYEPGWHGPDDLAGLLPG
mgnify:CR=1 FL=1